VWAGAIPAHAQDAHYWNNQYGTRAQLVGGLVVGSLVDLSATFYNPGAIAAVESPRLIVGTDAWEFVDITAERLTAADIEASSSRLRSSPSMFAISLPSLGRSRFSLSSLTRYNFDLTAEANRITSREDLESGAAQTAEADEVLMETGLSEAWFGLSWAYPVHPKIGIGATTYFAVRSQSLRNSLNASRVSPIGEGSTTILTDEFRYTNLRLLWKLGVAVDLTPLTIGLTVTTPGVQLSSSGRSFVERSLNDVVPPGGGDPVTELIADRQDDRPGTYNSPLSVAVGAAYRLNRTSFYFSTEWFDSVDEFAVVEAEDFVGQTTGDTISIDWSQRWRSVVNWGLGIQHELSDRLSLYGAFFTDRSAIEQPIGEVNLATASWDIYHVSVGTAIGIGSVDLTLGVGLGFGSDEDRDLFVGGEETADFSYRSFKLLLGLGTSL
jgi:hypothetical protein